MQLSKQQKIYEAVLLLAGVAFGVDRWVIGHGPEEASAALPGKTRPAAARPGPAPAPSAAPLAQGAGGGDPRGAAPLVPAPLAAETAPAPRPGARSLAVRLQEVVRFERLNLSDVPDAFRPSRRWDPPDMLLPPPPVAPVAPPRSDLASQFRNRHKLNAVMKGHAGVAGVAIINGRMFRVGQKLDDLTLVAVHEHSAEF